MLSKFIDVAAASSSGLQRLNYVDRTHLVLESGKLVVNIARQARSAKQRKELVWYSLIKLNPKLQSYNI